MRALHFWTLFLLQLTFSKQDVVEWDRTKAGPEQFCDAIWTGHKQNNTGTVCIEAHKPTSGDRNNFHLLLSYEFDEQWQIQENYLWIGNRLSEMPQVHGRPSLDDFSIIDRDIKGKSTYDLSVPLSANDIATSCDRERTTLYLALHPVIVPSSLLQIPQRNNSRYHTKEEPFLRGQKQKLKLNKYPYGFPWMEFELVLPCQWLRESTEEQGIEYGPPANLLMDIGYRRRHHTFKKQRQLQEGCNPLPPNEATSDILTEDFLFRFYTCLTLGTDVAYDRNLIDKKGYYQSMYEQFDAFDDGFNDVVVVAKVEDVCYAVFRGTDEFNCFDMMQNLLPGFRKLPGTDCFVRKGFYDAYFTNYQEDFEQAVRGCVDSCEGDQCELVLSGGSQGAGVAVSAGIYLFEEYDPMVLSIGVMRAFLPTSPFNRDEVCTHFNKDRHFHFILTDTLLEVYDPVPYMYAFWAKNAGHEILYDEDGNFNYQGISHNYNMRRDPSSMTVHTRVNYVAKSNRAYENLCLPAPAVGWRDGHWCSEDSNCMTSSYCEDDGYCAPRLELAARCTRGTACHSGSCIEGQCSLETRPLLRNEAKCEQDDECESGRCDGMRGFSTCHTHQESGENCNEHSDCISGHCAIAFFSGKCL